LRAEKKVGEIKQKIELFQVRTRAREIIYSKVHKFQYIIFELKCSVK